MLAEDLRSRLGGLPGVELRDLGAERCGIVTFSVEGHAAQDVTRRLSGEGTTPPSPRRARPCSTWKTGTWTPSSGPPSTTYDTEEEVARYCAALEDTLSRV